MIEDITVYGFETGIHAKGGEIIKDSHIHNNEHVGVYAYGGYSGYVLKLIRTKIENNLQHGVEIDDIGFYIEGCEIKNNGYHGIYIRGIETNDGQIRGCYIYGNSYDNTNTYDNIYIEGFSATYQAQRIKIIGNTIDGGNYARYNVNEAANADYNIITNNNLRGAVTANLNITGTNTITPDNIQE